MANHLFYLAVAAAFAPRHTMAESALIFPAMRRRLEIQRQAAAQLHAEPKVPVPKVPVPPRHSSPDKEQEQVAVVVPPPVDIGEEGFPKLPAVEQMLSEASGTLKSVNSQASALQTQLLQAQVASEAKLAKQKEALEQKLQEQEDHSRAIIAANANISAEIERLQVSNDALRSHAHALEESNRVTSSELRALQAKLDIARDFTAMSLRSTDDSNRRLLQLLKVGKDHGHHSKQALVELASRRTQHSTQHGTSLLLSGKGRHASTVSAASPFETDMSELTAMSASADPLAPVPKSSSAPSILLSMLSKDIAQLAQQDKESQNKLKQTFVRDFRAGAKRHAALRAQQRSLIATRESLLKLQAELRTVVEHLKVMRVDLDRRLRGLGHFLQKLAHFALVPKREHDVPRWLEVLPTSVAVKVDNAA